MGTRSQQEIQTCIRKLNAAIHVATGAERAQLIAERARLREQVHATSQTTTPADHTPYTLAHDAHGTIVLPTFGEVILREGKICARVVDGGERVWVTDNEGAGFPSFRAALEFVQQAVHEGASVR